MWDHGIWLWNLSKLNLQPSPLGLNRIHLLVHARMEDVVRNTEYDICDFFEHAASAAAKPERLASAA